jgi:CheY-like chemotaxis protein
MLQYVIAGQAGTPGRRESTASPAGLQWSVGWTGDGMAPNGSVLVVDDDDSIREFVSVALTDEGYDVLTAADGAEALETVRRRMPGVILLDMRMPVMDGWEFSRAYRASPEPHAPIVVVTAARDVEDRARQIEADGYLAKPFDLDDLLAIVKRFTGHGLLT